MDLKNWQNKSEAKPDISTNSTPSRYAPVIGKTAHIHESLKEGQKAIVFIF